MTSLAVQAQIMNLLERVAKLERKQIDHEERIVTQEKKEAERKKTLTLPK